MSASLLKLIAIIAMLIDHVGATMYPDEIIFRIIGRIAFPIFAFFIAEGFRNTSNRRRYMIRLLLFGLISEIPFDLAFSNTFLSFGHQNVFFTLGLGVLALDVFTKFEESNRMKALGYLYLIGLLSAFLRTDYNIVGILMIVLFYEYRFDFKSQVLWVGGINLLIAILGFISAGTLWGGLQVFAIAAFGLLYQYNDARGFNMKYLFYIFYPGHLMVLYFLQGGHIL